jgi:hypothetical protein
MRQALLAIGSALRYYGYHQIWIPNVLTAVFLVWRDLKPYGAHMLCTAWKLDAAPEQYSLYSYIAHISCFVTCIMLPVSIFRADERDS